MTAFYGGRSNFYCSFKETFKLNEGIKKYDIIVVFERVFVGTIYLNLRNKRW